MNMIDLIVIGVVTPMIDNDECNLLVNSTNVNIVTLTKQIRAVIEYTQSRVKKSSKLTN